MKLYYYEKSKNHKSADTDVLLQASVGAFCNEENLSPYKGRILRTSLGKPYLEGDYLHVGVTHTEDTIIIGISRKPFGIDCESKSRIPKNPERVMSRFFTVGEQQYVKSSENEREAFLDVWVRKEAYVKFTGEGISGLCGCDVTKLYGFSRIENHKNLIIYIYKEL